MAPRSGRRHLAGLPLVVAGIVAMVLVSSTVSIAQLDLIPTASPSAKPKTPEPSPAQTTPPANTATPTPDPVPSGILPDEEPTPTGKKTPKPKDTDSPLDELDELPEGLDEELVVPSFPRTRPRNTVALVKILTELTELDVPLEQALIEGMGRFPVAGLAHYYDDWLNPRFTPKPHLHQGLDIFADFGTPIRSPDEGVVSQLSDHGAGGTAVWMRGSDGTSYYFAHMLERVEGIRVGMRVEIGTVLGFVGDTGNASGGTPHLHFEIHPGAGEAVPPKPTVDAWLDEAEEIAPKWVEARREEIRTKGSIISSSSASGGGGTEEIEASMLLTLLDPVGGSVGLLPSLELRPRKGSAVSDRLLSDLIRERVAGYLFIPTDHLHLRD
jgi:murein DD-endopeptidase MepM/ murein hydrolase activator NlpD